MSQSIVSVCGLRSRSEYLSVKKGFKVRNRGFLLVSKRRASGDDIMGIGFTITRKIGNAVIRNRVRRRLREAMRALSKDRLLPSGLSGYNVVIIAYRDLPNFPFSRIVSDLESSFRDLSSLISRG